MTSFKENTMTRTSTQDLQEEFLSTLRKGQKTIIGALRIWVDTVTTVTPRLSPLTDKLPKLPNVTVPFADKLPTPGEAVDSAYGLAEQLLASQRKFADDMLSLTVPLMSGHRENVTTRTAPKPEPKLAQVAPRPAAVVPDPKPAAPKAVEPKPAEPKPAEPKPAAPKAAAPKAPEPKPVAPKAAEPKPAAPKAAEPKPAAPKAAEPKPAEPKPAAPKAAAPKPAEPKPAVVVPEFKPAVVKTEPSVVASAPKPESAKPAEPARSAAPKAAAPKAAAAPKTATPKTATPKTATPKTAAPKAAAPKRTPRPAAKPTPKAAG
jgi:hypothetical protein